MSNGEGQFASGGFGMLTGLELQAHTYAVWTFRFSSDCISAQNADLSAIICNSSIDNNF